ncbi:MAG: glycoside hydrolase family 32 protein [Oscillospiraceae bacterium]|nr:glycoside hydrolase family 32 protein [Oscillospiraceae bacterium]
MDYSAPLQYHYRPAKGWVNDPNGLVCFGGYYHVFYQHCPNHEIPGKEAMYWGHARTKDFLRWEELPVALAPAAPYDNCGCWSGTAIVKDDVLYLFYASLYVPEGETTPLQTVSVAYSTDGIHFEKYAGNPVIGHWPADGCPDFRDPAVCCVDGEYYCVMASGSEAAKQARLLLYKSTDLLHWEYSGILSSWENARFAECPSLVNAPDGRQLLAASVCTQEKHWFSLMYGRLADGKFHVEAAGEVDKGPDQYAGQVFADAFGRSLLISWVPGWPYAGYYAPKDIGCMSVPRQLTLGADGVVRGYPVKELQHLLKTEDPAVQRTADGFVIPRTGREPVVYSGELRELAILRDEYILEVFVNGGEEIYTVLL